jgi:glycosyltransferase involved in cell wall biosynthesis
MVTTFYPPYHFGGDAIYLQRLCHELADRGHQVEVIHNPDAYRVLTGHEPAGQSERHPNITVHELTGRSPLLSILAMQQLGSPGIHADRLRELLGRDLDVIHYHNVSLAGGPRVLSYGTAPKLYTTHEYWLVCPTHVLFRFNREACTRRTCLACQLSYRRPVQLWRYGNLLAESCRQVAAFLTPSAFAAAKHQQHGFTFPMLHLPLPGAGTQRLESRARAAPPYFLYVGRLERLKGVHTLLPLFLRHPEAQLWIVGTGSEESRLRALAGSASNVHFLGWVGGDKLRALYRDALAVIVPSLCYEVLSLVPLEAFQQATPVLARDSGSLHELITVSGAGALYHSDDQLWEAMSRLLNDATLRDELGQRGYQAYLDQWTPEVHLSRYLSLVDRLTHHQPLAEIAPPVAAGPAPGPYPSPETRDDAGE